MGTKIQTKYIGDGHVEITHLPTNSKILTDLPPDNNGKGRTFSPTDLMASSLASCILSIMSIMALKDNFNLEGTSIEIEKIMADNPRRIGKFEIEISFPPNMDEKNKEKYLRSIKSCPVHRSLHPDTELNFKVV